MKSIRFSLSCFSMISLSIRDRRPAAEPQRRRGKGIKIGVAIGPLSVSSALWLILACAILWPLDLAATAAAQSQQQQGGANNPNPAGTLSTQPAARFSIRGKIYMPSGNPPAERLRVKLEMIGRGTVQEIFSDSIGSFEFRDLPGGNYTIVVPSDGRDFETTSEMVEVYGRIPRSFNANIFLRAKEIQPNVRPAGNSVSVGELKQNIPKQAKKAYEKGLKSSEKGKIEEAIAHYKQAIELFPEYFQALNDLGAAYLKLNEFKKAVTTLRQAIEVNQHIAFPYVNLGIALVHQKQYLEAIEPLTEATRIDGSLPLPHFFLGIALYETFAPLRAEQELRKAYTLGGKGMALAQVYLANIYIRERQYPKAIEALETYLRDKPDAKNAGEIRASIEKMRAAK